MGAKLSDVLSQIFPSDEHVKKFCQPGAEAKTCRYLTAGGSGFGCAKYTSLRMTIDDRKDKMNARGDNCEGILKIIMEHVSELIGKRVCYRESMPTRISAGPLKEMKIEDGMFSIIWDYDGKEDYTTFAVSALGISISSSEIQFNLAGPGSFGGEAAIFLN
ncbi:hypothetical protein A2121_02600 [Candidatus Nomurabacteria bacterium GWB1_40_6]|uniref:Uncharacterized protein n=1 Tax=Candidatus Nomurabacteria bacterium GWB1_40_6 TaxID=1801727 RepID=A0A1F6TPI2_9BACT|nr:MAG: hypothetical protein A2121_02600 [Candidatus Nomurabacteria bacterium GWB1_40_6]